MSDKKTLRELSDRIDELREANHLSWSGLARAIGCSSTTAYRYQKGEAAPDFWNFLEMARQLDVSLDWLIAGRGDMDYVPTPKTEKNKEIQNLLGHEIENLLEHMTAIPELRYEILSVYHKFLRQNKELVSESVKD